MADSGYVTIKPKQAGSVSIGIFEDDNLDRLVMTIRDDNEQHDYGIVVLETWEAAAIASTIGLLLGKVEEAKLKKPKLMKQAPPYTPKTKKNVRKSRK